MFGSNYELESLWMWDKVILSIGKSITVRVFSFQAEQLDFSLLVEDKIISFFLRQDK